MRSPASLLLYPLLAVSLSVGLVAARLARRAGRGLLLLCLLLGAWTASLLLLEETGAPWAERLIAAGMLQAGAYVHAGADLSGWKHPRVVLATWVLSSGVALAGFLAPGLFFGPGARGPGPLFLPIAVISTFAASAVMLHQLRLVREARAPRERRQRASLLAANVFGALGGGGAISLQITGVAPVGVAAPFLLVSVVTAAYAVWSGEHGPDRALLREAFVSAAVGGILSVLAFGALARLLPLLNPGAGPLSPWAFFLGACLLAPLDPLRLLLVEGAMARALGRPVGVRALSEEARRASERAEGAERLAAIGKLASAVAHEVRNPLGVILAELELLERGGADAEGVLAVRAQVRRAGRFVDDLLRYARPRGLSAEDVDLAQVAREAAGLAARALGAEPSRLSLPAGRGPFVEGDREALGDIITNLVTNALIAAEGSPGARVTVALAEEGGRVRLSVEDGGAGVPPSLEARLFEAFTTGRARDERRPGTGLGLAICKNLVERHGGSIAHERPAGGGARFIVLLPRAQEARTLGA